MKETIRNRDEVEIDLRKLLLLLIRKWWILLLCLLIGALLSFSVSALLITPQYRSSVTVYVNNSRSGEYIGTITGSNLQAAQKLVSTYIKIIRSDTVLEKVSEALEINLSASQIRGKMSASQVGDTEMFEVSIVDRDPERATYIVNMIALVAPSEIENFIEGSSAKIVDHAKIPTNKYYPNDMKIAMVGGLVGFCIAAAGILLVNVLDARVRSEDDLRELFDIPVLMQLPEIKEEQQKRPRASKGGKKSKDRKGKR